MSFCSSSSMGAGGSGCGGKQLFSSRIDLISESKKEKNHDI